MTNMQQPSKNELIKELGMLKKAYIDLLIKEERYRMLAEKARDVIWTMKLDGRITYISPAVELLRGYTVEEAMHQTIDQILTPASQEKVMNYLQKLNSDFKNGFALENFKGENEYYCKNGSTLWTEVFIYPVIGIEPNSITLFGVTRDITERKQFEELLFNKTRKLREINATKDKFFSIIAHDLQSPINGILGFSGMLQREAHDLDKETIIKFAEIIHSSTQQTFSLLENLLAWAKTQQENFPFQPAYSNINTLIQSEIERLKHNAQQKGITLTFNTMDDFFANIDEKMLSTIIRNLISNAIKFTPRNGIIEVKSIQNTECFTITVIDNGIGMDNETKEKLFKIETFFTSNGTDNEKGTGLGLLLCKEFTEKHGGKISVESEIGQGSKFRISIPINN